jgi:hypothetical protein
MKPVLRLNIPRQQLPFVLLSILGLTFWFILGFPFQNSNESYIWLAQFKHFSFIDALTKPVYPVANYRPLGIATAWLGYALSGSIYPQQILNFLGALAAWLILFWAVPQRRLFAWVACIVTGAFFAGYIYLFHLHGVFYSPLLIFLALLLALSMRGQPLTTRRLVILSALALVIALFHPYALALLVAFLVGAALEHWRRLTSSQLIAIGLSSVAILIIIRLLVPSQQLQLSATIIQGFTTSYQAVELNVILSAVAWLLTLVTIVSLPVSGRLRIVLVVVVSLALPLFIRWHQPFLFVWLLVCLIKTVLLKKWSLALLLLAGAGLPGFTATGSPTYVLVVLMVCSVVTAFQWSFLEADLVWHTRLALAATLLALLVALPLALGVHVPVVSNLVQPVLAEKEKTVQLEKIIKWYSASHYSQASLSLCERADNPVESNNALDRTYRPPTSQLYLDAYLDSLRGGKLSDPEGPLLVCFGGETIPNAGQVFHVAGQYGGAAAVFDCTQPQAAACPAPQSQ